MTFTLILRNTTIELVSLLGPFLLAGLSLSFPARWINNVFQTFLFPRIGLMTYGLIGIPVHEFSHLFFCKVFFHEVGSVKWFDLKAKGGAHGSVTHHYHPWNPYHRAGHFFIGLGPAILGPVMIGLLYHFLVPASADFLSLALHGHLNAVQLSVFVLKSIFSRSTLGSGTFWIFYFLTGAIASQIELSREDMKQAFTGLIVLSVGLLLLNVFGWAIGAHWHTRLLALSTMIAPSLTAFVTLTFIVSMTNLIAIGTVFGSINALAGKGFINPFKP